MFTAVELVLITKNKVKRKVLHRLLLDMFAGEGVRRWLVLMPALLCQGGQGCHGEKPWGSFGVDVLTSFSMNSFATHCC